MAAGEQATARVGEAPRKSVLVNPFDAAQWSLYYPGIVGIRDYPLRGLAPDRLPQRLAEAEGRVAAAPESRKARIELGEILFDLGRQTEARMECERALAIALQDPRAHAGLGSVNLVAGNIQEALEEFRQARPPTLSALVGMSNALYRLGRFEEATAVITEAIRRFPSSPQPRTQAALLHLVQGRVSEALSELEQALALDPRHASAHGLLSNIYLVQNKKDLALQAAQQAVAANPFSPSPHLDLSLAKQAEFRLEEALRAARKAVELDPEDPQALIQVSRLLCGLERLSEAFKAAEQARHRALQDPLINTTWGFLLLAQGKVQEAIAAFDQAIQADSTRGEPHLGWGLALFQQGDVDSNPLGAADLLVLELPGEGALRSESAQRGSGCPGAGQGLGPTGPHPLLLCRDLSRRREQAGGGHLRISALDHLKRESGYLPLPLPPGSGPGCPGGRSRQRLLASGLEPISREPSLRRPRG